MVLAVTFNAFHYPDSPFYSPLLIILSSTEKISEERSCSVFPCCPIPKWSVCSLWFPFQFLGYVVRVELTEQAWKLDICSYSLLPYSGKVDCLVGGSSIFDTHIPIWYMYTYLIHVYLFDTCISIWYTYTYLMYTNCLLCVISESLPA